MPYFDSRHHDPDAQHQNVAATVSSFSMLNRRDRQDLLTDETWQQKVRLYDREGPGIVGASLDMPAATSMLLEMCIRKRTASGFEIVKDDPVLTAILRMWRGESLDQRHLFSRLLRTLDAVAECYLVLWNADRPGRLYWQLAQTTNVTDNRDGTVTIRERPGARRGDRWHRMIADRWCYHAMNSDLEWAGSPWSPLRRALPHIEQYKAAMRGISRNLDSQLAMNGVLWAKAVGEATQWPDSIKNWAARAISSDDGPESVIPFPMSTAEEPKFIDIGRKDHADQIEVANLFLKAFAQSSDLPTQMLLEGPGGGTNHWSAYLEGDFYADMTMAPRWQRACAIITETHLRPLLRGLPDTAGYLNPDDYSVWCDDVRIRTRTDNTERIIAGRDLGVTSREALAEAIGLEPEQVMELPDGITEFEAWLAARAPATLLNREATEPSGGALDAVVPDPPTAVTEPDRDESENRANADLDNGPPATPAVIEATVDINGELAGRRPDYWLELVPSHG